MVNLRLLNPINNQAQDDRTPLFAMRLARIQVGRAGVRREEDRLSDSTPMDILR